MTDPTARGGQGPGPDLSEDELRAYLNQLRSAEPGEFVAQAYNVLATVAQAKLGQPDARLLIDAMSGLAEATADRLPAELGRQMREGIAQLKLVQVQAERDVAPATDDTARERPSAAAGAREKPAGSESTEEPTQPGARMTDRLWIPGRDPRPPGGTPR
ncbi:MAG: hypothetical protein M3276_05600 [Actinomycetota bacterium]|nr:hypothetical protein [Actinomycetota bacterium]